MDISIYAFPSERDRKVCGKIKKERNREREKLACKKPMNKYWKKNIKLHYLLQMIYHVGDLVKYKLTHVGDY